MSPRPYHRGQRQAASEQTRYSVLQAARKLLMESTSFSGFSIEAVARRADVARMTIYHQFGSKMGLLEALCDSLAVTGEMEQLMVFPTLRRSSSPSVGASGVGLGGVGLHGRPRPVPLAPILVEDDRLPHPRATIKAHPTSHPPPSPLRIARPPA